MATVEKALRDGGGTMGSIKGTVERKEAPIMLFLPKKKEKGSFRLSLLMCRLGREKEQVWLYGRRVHGTL